MALGRTLAVALRGLRGPVFEVEAHHPAAVPGVSRVGLPDAALAESPQAAVLAEAVPPASDMLVGALLVLLSLLMLASLVWTVF